MSLITQAFALYIINGISSTPARRMVSIATGARRAETDLQPAGLGRP